jgi:hypothetical protein
MMCLTGFFTGAARAQLFLENGKETLTVSGGERLNGTLLLHNTSASVASVRVYWEDFQYKPPYDGGKNFLPAGTTPDSASQWVTFAPQNFSIPPYGQQNIQYTVTVPPTINEGHYGVLFFERSSDALGSDMGGVTLVTRVGCLFFVEPRTKSKKAAIEGVAAKGHGLAAAFVNQGNVIMIPRTTYYVMRNDGMVLLRGEAKKLYVPPGARAPFDVVLNKKLDPGQYSMVINSDLGDGDVVVKEIELTVDAAGELTVQNSQ